MKIKDKLKLSFCIMIILPIVLCSCAFVAIFKYQAMSIKHLYDMEDNVSLESLYSPSVIMAKLTDGIYESMQQVAEVSPEKFKDKEYLKYLDEELKKRLSCLIITKDKDVYYVSDCLKSEIIKDIIPEYSEINNEYNVSTYRGGDYQCIVKQINYVDPSGNHMGIFIVTSLEQVIPQIKWFAIQGLASILLVMLITSLVLNLWIYSSIVRPLCKLKLATDNIKNGNLDFEMPKISRDEIGDVCKDFEEMRVTLKQNAEEKINADIEEKELIRNISHDLKTPLTAIKGYVEGLMDGVANTPEKQKKYIQTIANKVNDMDKLIDELTIYSRLDTNRIPYTFNKINIKDYFDDCCDEIRLDLEAQDIALVYNCHNVENVYINADAEQLKRVVNNIVSNSVKYMSVDKKGRIGIDIYDEGDYAHIYMTDNGKGIGSDELPHIFERFYRTDESRNSKQGGSGIGLAIVKKIIEDHKGKIWAESVEGEGTTIHICLRTVKDADEKENVR